MAGAARDETEARKAARAAEDDLAAQGTEARASPNSSRRPRQGVPHRRWMRSAPNQAWRRPWPPRWATTSPPRSIPGARPSGRAPTPDAWPGRPARRRWRPRSARRRSWPRAWPSPALVDAADGAAAAGDLPPGAAAGLARRRPLALGRLHRPGRSRPTGRRCAWSRRPASPTSKPRSPCCGPARRRRRTQHEAAAGRADRGGAGASPRARTPARRGARPGRAPAKRWRRLRREGARRDARAQSLDETIARLRGRAADAARADVEASQAAVAGLPADTVGAERLAPRGNRRRAREAAFQARAALDRRAARAGRPARAAARSLTRRPGRLDAPGRGGGAAPGRAGAAAAQRPGEPGRSARRRARHRERAAAPARRTGGAETRKAQAADALATAEASRARGRSRLARRRVAAGRRPRGAAPGPSARLEAARERCGRERAAICDAAGLDA